MGQFRVALMVILFVNSLLFTSMVSAEEETQVPEIAGEPENSQEMQEEDDPQENSISETSQTGEQSSQQSSTSEAVNTFDYFYDEEDYKPVLNEVDVSILEDNCLQGECHDFVYDNPGEVVYFTKKPAIRFTSNTTYVFKKPQTFEVLKFLQSRFVNFPLNLFYTLKIEELDMRNCSIGHLTWENFLKAESLSILLLSNNRLKEIPPSTFKMAENLAFLFLDNNEIRQLHKDSFQDMKKLFMLDLHDNQIANLPKGIFDSLTTLQELNLAGNHLRIIENTVFLQNPRLRRLHLDHNNLEQLEEYFLQSQKDMDFLDLSHNPMLQNLVANLHVDHLWVRNCSINRVNIYGKVHHVDLQSNSILELYFSRPDTLKTLRLSDNSLQQISSLSQATNLEYFDVSNNPHLKTLPEYWETDSLQTLDLSNTSLTAIPIAILSASERLKTLNVSHNRLTHLDPDQFRYFQNLNHFYLHGNNWNCYSLQIMMDMLIRPWQISYTMDEYDPEYPGEYIGGIKCMYRLRDPNSEEEENSENVLQDNIALNGLAARLSKAIQDDEDIMMSSDSSQDSASDVDILRNEFKAVIGIYEQKFKVLLQKIDELDRRLKVFEQFNKNLQQITITV
ncbi:leucine-rich repeat-containing protein 15 [Musca vetustissima]|uniref:leucine-rich repeat-containing protein 15 n=1 Tax=Musca vetustissima TaxID=27455 RepID=UPI002AB6EFC5|nr:leucine-rich repeat-containing protein 15 [Musca vetustissima]